MQTLTEILWRQRAARASDWLAAAKRIRAYRPDPEILEGRALLAASLAPIANLSVPAQQGYVLPLDGSGTTDAQRFSITRVSGSPEIVASMAQGPFWTVDVSYTDPITATNDFSGPMTFQLFQSTTVDGNTIPLTTGTVQHIEEFTNDGYYTSPTNGNATPTKLFNRIINLGPSGQSEFIAQGGGPDADDTGGTSGQPTTPYPNEEFQQIPLDGTDQLAMANAGVTVAGTNDTQFFITTSNLNSSLGYNYTVFGQMISGQAILSDMVDVPTIGYNGQPANSVAITGVSLSSTNPNGVALIDTTQAKPGDRATFRVTATDSADGTSTVQEFVVVVGPYTGPASPNINFKPFANPVSATVPDGFSTTSSLAGQNGYPSATATTTLTYSLVSQPSHGRITHFNASTGSFEYTPKPGFAGTDSFEYVVHEIGPEGPIGSGTSGFLATTTSNPGTVTITVTPRPRKAPPPVRLTDAFYEVGPFGTTIDVILTFSGPLSAFSAGDPSAYELFMQGKNGSFKPPAGSSVRVLQATYDQNSVDLLADLGRHLSPNQKFEIVVRGKGPHAVLDSLDRPISGGRSGKPGGNVIAIFGIHPG